MGGTSMLVEMASEALVNFGGLDFAHNSEKSCRWYFRLWREQAHVRREVRRYVFSRYFVYVMNHHSSC